MSCYIRVSIVNRVPASPTTTVQDDLVASCGLPLPDHASDHLALVCELKLDTGEA